MQITGKTLALFSLAALLGGTAIATPAHADWYDGHRYHHGHVPHGWVYDPRLGYYVAAQPVVVAPPGAVVVAQPAPPPGTVVVAQPGTVVAQPQPVIVQQPAPVIVEQPAPPPVGVNLGVHIR